MTNLFKVVRWKDFGDSPEKCPKCATVRQDFMFIMEGVLACYHCGTLFVPKSERYKELLGKKEQIALQEDEKVGNDSPNNGEFKCEVCGKSCASKLGLNAHMRSHKGAE